MNRGKQDDIYSKESEEFLKDTQYSEFNNNYVKSGKMLLNINDVLKTFEDITSLEFDAGKYFYKQEFTKDIIQNKKQFDFLLDIPFVPFSKE